MEDLEELIFGSRRRAVESSEKTHRNQRRRFRFPVGILLRQQRGLLRRRRRRGPSAAKGLPRRAPRMGRHQNPNRIQRILGQFLVIFKICVCELLKKMIIIKKI